MTELTPETLQACCTYWQRILRLQDWDIEVRFARRHEFPAGKEKALASVIMDSYKRARVTIVDPIDYADHDWPIDRDSEASLVHELVHLHLADCRIRQTGSDGLEAPEWTALERAVETFARALLTVERVRTRI